MSFRLKDAVFKVRCREPGCPFNNDFSVKENIMGATEADVDSEAMKIARNMGFIKHDALYGRKHQLMNPEVYKVDARYERIGTSPYTPQSAPPAFGQQAHHGPSVPTRTYRRGEVIIRQGESATTVCEVIHGVALNEKLPDLAYKPGSTFGAASIFKQKKRMVDIVAGEDETTIAFYDLRELARSNPAKARELYEESMEDIFHILKYLEGYAASLEKQVSRLQAAKKKAPSAKKKGPAKKKAPAAKKKTTAGKKKAGRR
ncbi:MAG TPA: cyclic nucleotide-binding domain-containing protein [Spirochaetia bacterium]|nr:cyclic nucleotide-binding domain-containing protein [Spirochaetia bacterium]